jgi:hypothetical protein
MKLAVIKRRKAGDTVLLQGEPSEYSIFSGAFELLTFSLALQAIVDNMTYSESNLTESVFRNAVIRPVLSVSFPTVSCRNFGRFLNIRRYF